MALKDFGKGFRDSLKGATDTLKTRAKEIELSDIKKAGEDAVEQVRGVLKKKEKEIDKGVITEDGTLNITSISNKNALKIICYLMAADGEIFHNEEEKFDSIGKEIELGFAELKDKVVSECQASLDRVIDSEDYYDALQDGVEAALLSSQDSEEDFITPKLLVWNLLTVAYSDENYNDVERKLIKYIVRKLNINKAVFLEMESSILTLIDLEKELDWVKTTKRPYLTIEAMVNEITNRKNAIFESVKDLISL